MSCGFVAASDLPLVLQAVGELDRELTQLTRHASVLDTPVPTRDYATILRKLRASVGRTSHAMGLVQERVLDSTSELSVDRLASSYRGRAVVLRLQLQELRLTEPEVVQHLWPAPGRFHSLDDMSSFVCDRIGRVNAGLVAARHDAAKDDHRALVAAVAKAEHQLLEIGRDNDLVCFLAAGAAMTSPRFRTACRVIAALLGVPLAPEHSPASALGPPASDATSDSEED